MDAGDAGCDDDRSTTTFGNLWYRVLQAQPHTADVDGDDLVEHLDVLVHDWLHLPLDASVGDKDVDTAEGLGSGLDIGLCALGF